MILAFSAPVVVAHVSGRMAVAATAIAAAGLVTANLIGWFDTIGRRMAEFSSEGTSGYARFAVPINLFLEQMGDPAFLFTGNGAGTTTKGDAYLLLPFAKVVSEYGILTFMAFYGFLLVALFRKSGGLTVGYAMFVFYNFSGSTLALPIGALLLVVLATMYEVPKMAPCAKFGTKRR